MKRALLGPPGAAVTILLVVVPVLVTQWAAVQDWVAQRTNSSAPFAVTVVAKAGYLASSSTKQLDLTKDGNYRSGAFAHVRIETVEIELHNLRIDEVDITDIEVHVIARGPILHGSLVVPDGIGGGEDDINLATNLDRPPLEVLESPLDGGVAHHPYFDRHHIRLTRNETVIVGLAASATNAYYQWDLTISYTYRDRVGVVQVGQSGIYTQRDPQPFSVTGPSHLGAYTLVYSSLVDGATTPELYCQLRNASHLAYGIPAEPCSLQATP